MITRKALQTMIERASYMARALLAPALRRMARGLTVVALVATLVACSDDGRELRPPGPGLTVSSATTSTSAGAVDAPITFGSPKFKSGGAIPRRFTCDGTGLSPPLVWKALPAAATELAVVVTDPDADGFLHWVIAGLDPALEGIAAGARPERSVEARGSNRTIGWVPPCPPKKHNYLFSLYVLAEPLGMQRGLEGGKAVKLIADAAIATVTFTGDYQRP